MKYIFMILAGLVLLSFSIWAHHMIQSGVNPFSSNFFVIPLITIFLVGIIYLKKKVGMKSLNSTSRLFSIGFVLFLILSALIGTFGGDSAIDIQMHDTYFVITRFHILVLISLLFGFYTSIYILIPKLAKRKLNETLGKIHFGITTICVFFLIYLFLHTATDGLLRRYYSIEGHDPHEYFRNINSGIIITIAILLLSQITFLVNVAYSLLKSPPK